MFVCRVHFDDDDDDDDENDKKDKNITNNRRTHAHAPREKTKKTNTRLRLMRWLADVGRKRENPRAPFHKRETREKMGWGCRENE